MPNNTRDIFFYDHHRESFIVPDTGLGDANKTQDSGKYRDAAQIPT